LIYRSLARRDELGMGAWSALGLFKPQLFFLFPLVFVASRRWRALGAYVITACALGALSLVLVGVDGMQAWLRILLEPESGNALANGWRMTSAKSFIDTLLPGQTALSWALYAVLAVLVIGVLLRLCWRREPPVLSTLWPLTVLIAALVDPHLVDYDLTILVSAGIVGAALAPRASWLILALYLVTLLRAAIPLGDVATMQLTGPLLAALAFVVARSEAGQFGRGVVRRATIRPSSSVGAG